jgi:outer membrane receptor for Fe3+-dicitrate
LTNNHGFIKSFESNNQINFGDRVSILKDKMTFQKGYEPIFSKTIYIVHSGDGYTYKLQTEEGIKLKRSYKIYELQKLTSSVKYQHGTCVREKPLTQRQKKTNVKLLNWRNILCIHRIKREKYLQEIILFNKR